MAQTNSSLGPDGIHLRALNQPKDEITQPRAVVCNLSLGIASVAGARKVAKFYRGFQEWSEELQTSGHDVLVQQISRDHCKEQNEQTHAKIYWEPLH